ncbi:MAG: hypothetical protein QXU32_00665 [Nitrososphaerales archaeon]
MADINAYALGIELQLQTAAAFEAISKLKNQIAELHKVAYIGPRRLPIPDIGASENKIRRLSEAYHDLTQAHAASKQLADAIWNIAESIEEVSIYSKDYIVLLSAFGESIDDAIASLERERNAYREVRDAQGKLTDEQRRHLEYVEDQIKALQNLRRSVEQYDKQVNALNESLIDVGRGLLSQSESANAALDILGKLKTSAGASAVVLAFLSKGIYDVISAQDKFATVNYRALGTNRDLIVASNTLRSTLGATASEATEVISALGEAGFRASDDIDNLAQANYKFSQTTGVAVDITAIFQRRLVALSGSTDAAAKALTKVSAVIRQSGLTAREAGSLMSQLDTASLRLFYLYGEKQATELTAELIKLAGAAKAAGGSADIMFNMIQRILSQPVEAQKLFAFAGAKFDERDLKGSLYDLLPKLADRLNEYRKEGKDAAFQAQRIAEMMGVSIEEAANLILLMDKVGGAKGIRDFVDRQKEAADLEADFAEATRTLTRSLKQLLEPLLSIGAQIADVIVPAVSMILQPIAILVRAVASLVNFFQKIPVIGPIIKTVMGVMLMMAFWRFAIQLVSVKGKLDLFKNAVLWSFNTIMKLIPAIYRLIIQKRILTMETLRSAKAAMIESAAIAGVQGKRFITAAARTMGAGRIGGSAAKVAGSAAQAAAAGYAAKAAGSAAQAAAARIAGGAALKAVGGILKFALKFLGPIGIIASGVMTAIDLYSMFKGGGTEAKEEITAEKEGEKTTSAPSDKDYEPAAYTYRSVVDAYNRLINAVKMENDAVLNTVNRENDAIINTVDSVTDAFRHTNDVIQDATINTNAAVGHAAMSTNAAVGRAVMSTNAVIERAAIGTNVAMERAAMNANAAVGRAAMNTNTAVEWAAMSTNAAVGRAVMSTNAAVERAAISMGSIASEILQPVRDMGAQAPAQEKPVSRITAEAKPLDLPDSLDLLAMSNAAMLRRTMEQRNVDELVKINKSIAARIDNIIRKIDDKFNGRELAELLKTWLPQIADNRSGGGLSSAINQWV